MEIKKNTEFLKAKKSFANFVQICGRDKLLVIVEQCGSMFSTSFTSSISVLLQYFLEKCLTMVWEIS